jgi:hypothetical protein
VVDARAGEAAKSEAAARELDLGIQEGSSMKGVELAHTFSLGLCNDPKCKALHFDLEREDGETFAVMTIAADSVPRIIEIMRNLAYAIAATRTD